MFTGVIQKIGRLETLTPIGGGARIVVGHDPWPTPIEAGESIAVNGVCLTVTRAHRDEFECDVLEETLNRTNLGTKQTGAPLNLERALRSGDPIGGHFITGHVDGTGILVARRRTGRDWEFEIACGEELLGGMVLKGSVACDGVSLTITRLTEKSFAVCLIPYTIEHTAMNSLSVGDKVNIETDVLGKYVQRYLAASPVKKDITLADLKRAGFL